MNRNSETMRNIRHNFNLVVYQMGVLTTFSMYVGVINNEMRLLLPMVAEFMKFPNVVFAILLRRKYTSRNLDSLEKSCLGYFADFSLIEIPDA